jgi:hypothetical protein
MLSSPHQKEAHLTPEKLNVTLETCVAICERHNLDGRMKRMGEFIHFSLAHVCVEGDVHTFYKTDIHFYEDGMTFANLIVCGGNPVKLGVENSERDEEVGFFAEYEKNPNGTLTWAGGCLFLIIMMDVANADLYGEGDTSPLMNELGEVAGEFREQLSAIYAHDAV